jgi:nicotinamidase-related amidase
VVELLRPDDEDDYFVLKPKHSGFFSTTLDILLDYLQAKTLVLTGLTGDICVLFTAHDAYMRDFNLVIPADCVASSDPTENDYTLRKMADLMDADISPSTEVDFGRLKTDARREPEPNPEPEPKQTAR